MKKIFFGILAVVAMIATSCQQEVDLGVEVGKTATVSFEVGTPTRAYSDGTTATVLQYAVYEEETELTDLTKSLKNDNAETINISTTVNLQLVTGNTYTVIFWAAAPNAPYTVDFGAKTMTVDYNGIKSNNEALDAFYAKHTFTVKGAQTETIVLKRPFAQLNIGTSDYTASASAGYTPEFSKVTVKNIYNTLNLWNGSVEPSETGVEVVYDWAEIKKDEVFPVAGYEYLAMNYLLVNEKESITVVFEYSEEENVADKVRTVGSVPVQRNYRTNLYGQLLTSNVGINVTIDPIYEEPAHEVDALQKAAAFGGEVTLTEDVVLTSPLKIQSNFKINLNGKTISASLAKGNGAVVEIAEGIEAEIVGGTIKSLAENGDAAINNAGKLVLKNVAIEGAPLADGGYSAYAVISSGELTIEEGTRVIAQRGSIKLSGAGKTVINGGHFTNLDIAPRTLTSHVVDVEDGGTHELTINGGTFEHLHSATSGGVVICNRTRGTVYVNGGNYSGGNYYGNNNLSDYGYGGTFAVTGGVYTSKPAAKYIVAGYKAVAKNGKYYVVAEEVDDVATTHAEVLSAIKVADQTVCVAPTADGSAHKLEGKMSLAEGVSLIGMGDEPVALFNDWGSNAFANQAHFTNTTVENINFTNNLVIDAGIANGDVLFKNCVFGGNLAHQGVHFDSGNATIVFENCTFVGRNMFGASLTNVIFNNCTFLNKKSSLTGADKWTGVNMWGKYEFNNCVFDTEATCNVKCDGVEATFTNCKYVDNRDITTIISNSPNYTCEISFK